MAVKFDKILKSVFKTKIIPEFKFHPTRKWRADFAIPKHKILIEIEGGIHIRGRHVRASGYIKDMEKYNAATALGWRVLRFQPKDMDKSSTLDTIKETIANDKRGVSI